MLKQFRVYRKATKTSSETDYLVDHSIFTYLLGPDNEFIDVFGRDKTVKECVEKIKEAIEQYKITV